MRNPYAQVALTYFSRSFSNWRIGLFTVAILWMLISSFCFFLDGSDNPQKFSMLHLWLFVILFAYWAIHAKEQFADSRASLTPGFRRVHITVAAGMAIFLAVLLPGAMASLMGWNAFGFVAFTTLLFGAIFWYFLLMRGLICWLILAGFISIFTEPIRRPLDEMVRGNLMDQAFLVLAVGAAISVLGGIRLFLLNEDMPDYHFRFLTGRAAMMQMSEPQRRSFESSLSRGLRGRMLEKHMESMIYHARRASGSWQSRVCRWQVRFSFLSALFFVMILYLFFWAPTWITGKAPPINMMMAMTTFAPAFFTFATLWDFRRRLSHEFMMPVSRNDHLTERGMAAAIGQLQVWACVVAATILLMATTTAARAPSPSLLADVIGFSALSQLWMFGIVVWFLQYRSIGLSLLGLQIAIFSLVIPMLLLESPLPLYEWQSFLPAIGAVFAALGLLLTWRAYRRWLVTDLD
jgi:hypothetical protein